MGHGANDLCCGTAPYLRPPSCRLVSALSLSIPTFPNSSCILDWSWITFEYAWPYSRSLIRKRSYRSPRLLRSLPLSDLPDLSPLRIICKHRVCARTQASRKRGGPDRMPFHERVRRQYVVETGNAPTNIQSRGDRPCYYCQQGDDDNQRE